MRLCQQYIVTGRKDEADELKPIFMKILRKNSRSKNNKNLEKNKTESNIVTEDFSLNME